MSSSRGSRLRISSELLTAKITLPKLALSFSFDLQLMQLAAPALIPGLALTLRHTDFYMNQTLARIMDHYCNLLGQLKHNFRLTLRTPLDFEKSVRANEDGFFLSLFKLISEAQTLAHVQLSKFFHRETLKLILAQGGFSHVSSRTLAKVKSAQAEAIHSILSIIYRQAFEYFNMDESVFREQYLKEVRVVELQRKMKASWVPSERQFAEKMQTSFAKVYTDQEAFRAKHKLEGAVLTQRMTENYVRQVLELRGNLRPLPVTSSRPDRFNQGMQPVSCFAFLSFISEVEEQSVRQQHN